MRPKLHNLTRENRNGGVAPRAGFFFYAHVRCPRAFDYYATTAAAAFRAGDDVLRANATAVGAGSPLQRLDSVQIDAREYTSPEPLQRVPRVYSFEAMTSRSL